MSSFHSTSTGSDSPTWVTNTTFQQSFLTAMVSTERLNNTFTAKTDIPTYSTFFGNPVVNSFISSSFKSAIKNLQYGDVSYVAPQSATVLDDVKSAFNNAFINAVAKKLFNSNITNATPNHLREYLVAGAVPGQGTYWYTTAIKEISSDGLLSTFKVKFDLDQGNYIPVQVVIDPFNDPTGSTYANTPFYKMDLDLTSSNLAKAIKTNGNLPLQSSDSPEGVFSFADASDIVLGLNPNYSNYTAETLAQALAITKRVSTSGLLADLALTPATAVLAQTDARILSGLKSITPDNLWSNYITKPVNNNPAITGTSVKIVSGGTLTYPTVVKQIEAFVKFAGITIEALIKMYDSSAGDQANQQSTAFVSALRPTNPASTITAYGSAGVSNITFASALEAYINFKSNMTISPTSVKTSTDLAKYLSTDPLNGPVRSLIFNGSVQTTTVGGNVGYNAGTGGTLKAFLQNTSRASLDMVYTALTDLATQSIAFSKSNLTPDQVIRNTFFPIETNIDVSDFPPSLPVNTTGQDFHKVPPPSAPSTTEWSQTLLGLYMIQSGCKLMDNLDNHKHLSKFVKVGTANQIVNSVIISLPQQNYGIAVTAFSASGTQNPGVSLLSGGGGIITSDQPNTPTLGSSGESIFAAWSSAFAPNVTANSDFSIRTYIATVINGGVANTPAELDQLTQKYTLSRIASLIKTPSGKDNSNLITTSVANGFSAAATGLTLAKGYTIATDSGNSSTLDRLKLTSTLMDIYGTESYAYTRTKKQLDTLKGNLVAQDTFLDNISGSKLQGLLQSIIEQGFFEEAGNYAGSSRIQGADAMAALKSAVSGPIYDLESKTLAGAIAPINNQPGSGLTISLSNNIQSLGSILNRITGKDAYISSTNVVEARQTIADYISGRTSGSQSITVAVAAAAQNDSGVNGTRLTKTGYLYLRSNNVRDIDIRNAVTAVPIVDGFRFNGVAYSYYVGKNSVGEDIFEQD